MKSTAFKWLSALVLSVGTAGLASAQQPVVITEGHGDNIVMRGCIGRAAAIDQAQAQQTLVWTRGGIMLNNPMSVRPGQGVSGPERVFYWLDDDDDLSKHVGQMVEIKGDLGDFKKGEIEIDRDGEFTEIKLELGGKTEKVRVPTASLGTPRDGEIDIVSRKIDVDEVKVLGPCTAR